jgi:hypothetical protein
VEQNASKMTIINVDNAFLITRLLCFRCQLYRLMFAELNPFREMIRHLTSELSTFVIVRFKDVANRFRKMSRTRTCIRSRWTSSCAQLAAGVAVDSEATTTQQVLSAVKTWQWD